MVRSSDPRLTQRQKLPSLWTHTLGACTLLVAVGAALIGALHVYGTDDDAVAVQTVTVPARPQAVAAQNLNSDSDTLPDLLEGDVAPGTNPTTTLAAVDALGNPINADEGLAGGNNRDASPVVVSGQNNPPSAVITALTKASPFGPIPTISRDGRKPVNVYARPAKLSAGTKPIAIVIGGLGINRTVTQRAINELPTDVTLSFAAHAQGLQGQINQARARGFEVMIELPMESASFNASEPGANRALRVNGTNVKSSNLRNLDWLLSRAGGYFGVINYNGDLFLPRSDTVVPILARLSSSGLGFIFDGSSTAPSLQTLAGASGVPFTTAYTLIDDNPDTGAINTKLALLAADAKSGGNAPIGVGFSYPQTIDAVIDFTQDLNGQGLSLVPASSMLKGG
ncbi:divergent polysaccharide deacetylase family protein [Fretibacter rubidus]|uniref:divergent polysaccharide deacetylase family protein n=1 Tax=Fretibacter rubidus TaxID=570162 RepID=UPI00352AB48A